MTQQRGAFHWLKRKAAAGFPSGERSQKKREILILPFIKELLQSQQLSFYFAKNLS
ncbi:MAG: hypothetical protein ACLVDZ_09890 [Ruminococcus sp.]|jgi:hypothetical protein|nr:hypothetical protein [Bacillota bacterium]